MHQHCKAYKYRRTPSNSFDPQGGDGIRAKDTGKIFLISAALVCVLLSLMIIQFWWVNQSLEEHYWLEVNHQYSWLTGQNLLEDAESLKQTQSRLFVLLIAAASFIFIFWIGAIIWLKRSMAERRDLNLKLNIERAFIQSVLDTADALIVVLDRDGRLIRFNRTSERLTGYKTQEVVGRKVWDLFVIPEERDSIERVFRDLSDGNHKNSFENYWLTRTGDKRLIAWSNTYLKDEKGTVEYVIATGLDITSRRRAEEELREAKEKAENNNRILEALNTQRNMVAEQSNRMAILAEMANQAKSEFLTNMSHEVRTPLNGIVGMTELMLDTNMDATQREYMDCIKMSATNLVNLVSDVLDFSKIDAGKLELELIDFNLVEMMSDTLRGLALKGLNKGLELVFRIAPEIPETIIGDPGRLGQILVNLVDNAVKFTSQGQIIVSAEVDEIDSESIVVHFSVQDSGIGISREKHKLIFEAFEQADGSNTRRYGGTGLGLAISSTLVELMHGEIWLDSEVGRGSTFHFTCKLGLMLRQEEEIADLVGRLGDVRVLLGNGNEVLSKITRNCLVSWGMHVDPAYSEQELVAMLEVAKDSQRYRIVLLDENLVKGEIKSFINTLIGRGIPSEAIVVITSLGNAGNGYRLEKSMGLGACLNKPLNPKELGKVLVKICGGYEKPSIEASAEDVGEKPATPMRILVVEDNIVNQKLARRLLEKRGHRVTTAADGRKALDILADQSFDLALMDLQMPEMDGLTATRRIRARERENGDYLPIIAMTAHAMKGDRERCLEAGMDDYLAKPIDLPSLDQVLSKFVPEPS